MTGPITVDEYLDLFSEYDFDSYCLSVALTHRDFDEGVIGLAWLGYTSAAKKAGGKSPLFSGSESLLPNFCD